MVARGGIFLHGRSKGTKNANTVGQVARKPFYYETERQRPFNWHSGMHLDFALTQIQSLQSKSIIVFYTL